MTLPPTARTTCARRCVKAKSGWKVRFDESLPQLTKYISPNSDLLYHHASFNNILCNPSRNLYQEKFYIHPRISKMADEGEGHVFMFSHFVRKCMISFPVLVPGCCISSFIYYLLELLICWASGCGKTSCTLLLWPKIMDGLVCESQTRVNWVNLNWRLPLQVQLQKLEWDWAWPWVGEWVWLTKWLSGLDG